LARRRIISSFKLPPWAYTELLTNTVVQVVVDAGGKLVSVPLLLASSTYKPADDYALEQARSLRFEPATGAGQGAGSSSNGLAWGKIIFEWSTIPMVTTNAPSAISQP
jgi:TonB family protein